MDNQQMCYSTEKYTNSVICVENIASLNNNRILVKVMQVGLSKWDAKLPRLDIIKWQLNKQPIGQDFAGVVIEVDQGTRTTGFKSGDEVFGSAQGVLGTQINVMSNEITLLPINCYMKQCCSVTTPILTAFNLIKTIPLVMKDGIQELISVPITTQPRQRVSTLQSSKSWFEKSRFDPAINYESRMKDINELDKEQERKTGSIKSWSLLQEHKVAKDQERAQAEALEFEQRKREQWEMQHEHLEDKPSNIKPPTTVNVLVIGAACGFGVYSQQILKNLYHVDKVIGISSEKKRDYVFRMGFDNFQAQEAQNVQDVLEDCKEKGIMVEQVIDFSPEECSHANEYDLFRFQPDDHQRRQFWFRNNPKRYLRQQMNSEQFCKFPRPQECTSPALDQVRNMLQNWFVFPLQMREFEFDSQEVERAFKWIVHKDACGCIVIRVGDNNDTTINREMQLISRIKEKLTIQKNFMLNN